MSAHTAYYHVPPSYTQHAIPQGWRPPFQGPPPIPPGMDINPQLWQAGRWQPNPAYFAQHQGRLPQHPQQAWIASQSWQQQRAQESRNSFRRVPKPPSAEYLSQRLSDNPLGLIDMIPAEELYAQQQASGDDDGRHNTAESPWVWNPPPLDPDGDEQPDSSTNTSGHLRSSSRPQDESARQNTSTPRRSSDHHPEQPKTEDPFTAKRELVPTFSINIVRTPEHYKSSPSRASSRNSQTSRGSLDSQQLATRMEQLSTTDFPNPLVRQASMSDPSKPSSSLEPSQSSYLSGVSNLVDEPSNSLLSPLLLTTPKSSSRGIGRHSTFPMVGGSSSLDAIPETSSSDQQQYNTLSRKARNPARGKTEPIEAYYHSQHSPTNHTMTNGASPYYNTPSRSSQSPGSSRTSSQHTSPTALTPQSAHDHHSTPPTSGGSRHSNPLPQPPMEHYNGSQKRRVRKGYWNKRGDHLTMSGFIVYAPDDQVYPPELHDYPEASVAYRDEKGQVVSFLQRPELPDSRPRHGQPPVRPYSSFIEYV